MAKSPPAGNPESTQTFEDAMSELEAIVHVLEDSRLPLDQLKIDQSFVRSIGVTANDDVIVQAIIGMARTLGIDLIAEGVETVAQRDFLERSGCCAFQGYLYGRPQPLADFEAAVRSARG